MVKFIALIFIVIALAIIFIPSLRSTANTVFSKDTSEVKCITQGGDVYYGNIPKNVVCESVETIDVKLSVIKSSPKKVAKAPKKTNNRRCDGRKYCSQMTSCNEAIFFINNCPNTLMDGNNDGMPCEKQWCKF